MKTLINKVRLAIDKFNMIDENDNIAVCVSGGKDSVFLLYALSNLKEYYPKAFNFQALVLDPGFEKTPDAYSSLEQFCQEKNIRCHIKKTDLFEIIFNIRKEKNPCSLCSRMRKGILNEMAKELGCNKIALGHNFNDVVETFIMSLFNNGNISCFTPVTYLSRKNLYAIRPLIYCPESSIIAFVKANSLPIIKSLCPADKNTQRQKIKDLLLKLEAEYPDIKSKIFTAIKKANPNGWLAK